MSVLHRVGLFLCVLFLWQCKEAPKAKKFPKLPKLRTNFTFEEFLQRFHEIKLPAILPETFHYKQYAKTIGVEFYDTFVVKKLFGKKKDVSYAYYATFKHPKVLPLIIIEERKNGSFYYLLTLKKKEYSVIDSAVIAFTQVSEEIIDEQKAKIFPNYRITAQRNLAITKVPKTEAELLQKGIQVEKKNFSYQWQLTADGTIRAIHTNSSSP